MAKNAETKSTKKVETINAVEKKSKKKEKSKNETFENGSKNIFKIIWNFIFWAVVILLFIVWIIDFNNVKNKREPAFCLKNVTHQYDDGTVEECIGLGYKVYKYDRKSSDIKGSQFSPFFIGMNE